MHSANTFLRPFALLFSIALLGAALFAADLPAWAGAGVNAVPGGYAGKPYGGKAAAIPGIVQAESYDIAPGAANGITFNYGGSVTQGPMRTSGDCVGLAKFGDGHVTTTGVAENPNQVYVGWTNTGEWLKYTVHVAETGTYQIGGQFSAAGSNCKLSFTFAPTLTTGPVAIPTTAGFQLSVEVYHVWKVSSDLAEIALPQGDYVMTVKIESDDGLNLDYYSFTKKPWG